MALTGPGYRQEAGGEVGGDKEVAMCWVAPLLSREKCRSKSGHINEQLHLNVQSPGERQDLHLRSTFKGHQGIGGLKSWGWVTSPRNEATEEDGRVLLKKYWQE